jgi:plastocyanin
MVRRGSARSEDIGAQSGRRRLPYHVRNHRPGGHSQAAGPTSFVKEESIVLTLARAAATGALVLALAGCSGAASSAPSVAATVAPSSAAPAASSAAPSEASSAAPSAAAGDAVTIQGFSFKPDTINVKTGATITWTNNDSTAHTVTFDDGSQSSKNIGLGGTFQRTFSAAGTFAYHCSIHPTMTATVTVAG